MNRIYYTTGESLCVKVAIANALLELNDKETAKRVMSEYDRSPLVLPNGRVDFGCTPRLIREVTGDCYTGKLYICPSNWLEHYREWVRPDIAEIISQDIREGWILERGGCIEFQDPAVLLVSDLRDYHHAITTSKDGKSFIDNGQITPTKVNPALKVIGVQEIRRV